MMRDRIWHKRAVTQVRNAELVKLQQKELQESHHPKIVESVQSRPRNNSNSKRCPACGYWCLKTNIVAPRCPLDVIDAVSLDILGECATCT